MKGYDEYNTILLPPRKAGDQLPSEISGHYYEQEKMKEQNEKKKAETAAKIFDDQLRNSLVDMETSPHSELSQSALDVNGANEEAVKTVQESNEVFKGNFFTSLHCDKLFNNGC